MDIVRLEANWAVIRAELEAPRPRLLERTLRRLGIPAAATRLVVATPALRRAWLAAVAVVVLLGIGAAQPDDPGSLWTFLVLTPILPVLGVALAYGPASDPMYEAQLATPMQGLRLLAVRALVVQVVAVAVGGAVALLTPSIRPMALAWLLPGLALTAAMVAGMSALTPRRAAASTAVAWVLGVVLTGAVTSDQLAAFAPGGQLVMLVVGLVAMLLAYRRRDRFDHLALT